jgi:tRNA modification GTPase
MDDTIFALSSGSPPAAIAVVRVSGPQAHDALERIAGPLPQARRAGLRTLRDAAGEVMDQALVLVFPGPNSATGEDCGELHCHGGRAVVSVVCAALAAIPGLRGAEPGEFTRRAFANGRIDLAQAEALGDLLSAETELQRRAAQAGVGGALSREVEQWRGEILALSAMVEAALDFSDEDDVEPLPGGFEPRWAALHARLQDFLARPRAERLREGIRVVLAGPPNSGKSSLFNALIGDGAAIVSPEAGTTRDVLERAVAFAGVPFVLIDTAGLRSDGAGPIEAEGIARAHDQLARADIVLWLGPGGEGPEGAMEVQPRSDDPHVARKRNPDHIVSSMTGEGLAQLEGDLIARARGLLPNPGAAAVNRRQAQLLEEAARALSGPIAHDLLLLAEALRSARSAFDRLLGNAGVEDMLDALFARFCIGK